ncbi:ATP-binding protein [Caenispirillum salinarum]|uniref:sensor histidine kinase n=1 Tax=Caenispirillum salinarum TaxID=859058 RepID=UPI00384AFA66
MTMWGRQTDLEARQRLYDLGRLVSDWIWETDPAGRFTVVSQRSLDILAVLPEELAGRSFADFAEEPETVMGWLAEQRPFRDRPCLLRRRGGRLRHARLSALPWYDPATGAYRGMRGTCRDVTEEVLAHQALSDQLAFQQSLLDAIPTPIFYRGANGRYGLVNRAFADMVGRPVDAVLGASLFDLFPTAVAQRLFMAASLPPSAGEGVRQHVDRLPWTTPGDAGGGKERDVVITLAPARAPGDTVAGLVGVVTDITDRCSVEADLQRTVAALEASGREMEQFLHVASHDLQEPTRTVVSFCQLLARSLGDAATPAQADYIDHAVDGAHRMRAVVEDLGSYARAGVRPAAPAVVDCAPLVGAVLQGLRGQAEAVGASVEVGALPAVCADRAQVSELFRNLLDNALKFAARDRPTVITVDVVPPGADDPPGHRRFCVADNGIGIPPDQREQVFALFRRLHGHHAYPGTGAGLAVCRRIVERHGGRIWIDPGTTRGTAVLFTLPEADPARVTCDMDAPAWGG